MGKGSSAHTMMNQVMRFKPLAIVGLLINRSNWEKDDHRN